MMGARALRASGTAQRVRPLADHRACVPAAPRRACVRAGGAPGTPYNRSRLQPAAGGSGFTLLATPRSRMRKSEVEELDQPERALLFGEATLSLAVRANSCTHGQRRAKRYTVPRARTERSDADGEMRCAEAHASRSAGLRSDGYALHNRSVSQHAYGAGEWTPGPARSADDCAAASALAMLFECASRVDGQGA